tara:strand:+ start:212 stop:1918 length:1707 start_codon:yes stop_codon:yes gene_type:complete
MARPKRNGDPTKADTARLVSYSENLVKALEDAGYRLDKRVPILETRYEANRSQDKEAYEKSIDVDDLYEGVIRTPYLADDILGYAAGLRLNVSQLQGDRFEISERQRKAIIKSFEEHLALLKDNSAGYEYGSIDFGRLEMKINRLKDAIEGDHRAFLKAVDGAGYNLYEAFEKERDFRQSRGFKPIDDAAVSEVYDNIDFVNQNEYKGSPRARMIGALGVSGIADLDYYQSLSDQGYTYPDSPDIRYDGKITPSSIAKSIGNFGIDLYNRLNMDFETVDRGDKGTSRELVNPHEMIEEFEGGDIIDSMFSVYPNVKTEHTKVETPWSKEKGQYYRDLGEGFYEDREYDRVQNFDIPPSLFREGITPASIKTYWNEDKQDFIEVYDYDSPEFRKAGGVRGGNIPSDGDDIGTVPTPVRVKKKTQPVRLKKKILPTAKRVPPKPNYQTEGPGFSFTPVFRGDIQQSAYRGRGTTDALSGVSMDFVNPDGTIRRMTTDLSDVPDYITKDPYFERLLNTANEKYFQLEREKGSEGTQQAVKTPEAQMIGRILSGDITIDEAKRQGKYTYASF